VIESLNSTDNGASERVSNESILQSKRSLGGKDANGSAKESSFRIMDVGSKSGAYDYKSPKLILQEMRQRDKMPKTRYKGIYDEEKSLWRCKVCVCLGYGGESLGVLNRCVCVYRLFFLILRNLKKILCSFWIRERRVRRRMRRSKRLLCLLFMRLLGIGHWRGRCLRPMWDYGSL
jgi:hypothetical protein